MNALCKLKISSKLKRNLNANLPKLKSQNRENKGFSQNKKTCVIKLLKTHGNTFSFGNCKDCFSGNCEDIKRKIFESQIFELNVKKLRTLPDENACFATNFFPTSG